MFKQRGKFYGTCSLTTKVEDATHCGNDSPYTSPIIGPGMSNTEAAFSASATTKDEHCPGTRICDTDKRVACVLTGTADVCISTVSDFASRSPAFAEQLFMGDGREDDTATALSTVSLQTQKYTRCLVCHGSQEFAIPQAQSSGKIFLNIKN